MNELRTKISTTESKIAAFDKAQEWNRGKSISRGQSMEKISTKNNLSIIYNNSAILSKIVQDVHEIKHFLNVNLKDTN